MKIIIILTLILLAQLTFAQHPNDVCNSALLLQNATNYCSNPQEYNNIEAINEDISLPGKDVWFKFTAIASDVNIILYGDYFGTGQRVGTLKEPTLNLYTTTDCIAVSESTGSTTSQNNSVTLYRGRLQIGTTYYIRVSAKNDNTGTFKLCVDNYAPPLRPGQDYGDAIFLCSKESFTESNIAGAGLNNREANGSCLGDHAPTEENSVWYKWKAANNGTLVFTITPSSPNIDIDWVLYDLGTSDDASLINPSHIIRCSASQICSGPTGRTGLSFTETDVSEPPGCGAGQNDLVKYADMQQGHYYALLVNNFSAPNQGFTLDFKDPSGKSGSGEFGPLAAFNTEPKLPAQLALPATINFFNQSVDADIFLWKFGDGEESTETNPVHEYKNEGNFTVTLTASKTDVCSSSTQKGQFIIRKSGTVFIPNTFTPNGDGINDEFVIHITNLESYQIRIFNRYGSRVFISNDIFDAWKGIQKGEPLPVGTYYYSINAIRSDGYVITQSGPVSIIR